VTSFALLHGGCHGGWCWERVAPLLQARGHEVVAPDLPMSDVDAGVAAWADVVVRALAGHDDDGIVVGHSLGGLAVPVVAARRPVTRMVFLGAVVPMPGMAYADYLATPEGLGAVTMPYERAAFDDQGRTVVPADVARDVFYPDCTDGDVERAVARLTPTAGTAFAEACPLDAWPDVPSTYILMRDDRAVSPEWSRRVARERLGVEPLELPGSHSPFYSRPAELADLLSASRRAR
jgi:pimeloyl-ACP methyl ester carboxylesterase